MSFGLWFLESMRVPGRSIINLVNVAGSNNGFGPWRIRRWSSSGLLEPIRIYRATVS